MILIFLYTAFLVVNGSKYKMSTVGKITLYHFFFDKFDYSKYTMYSKIYILYNTVLRHTCENGRRMFESIKIIL